jgi:thioredoxin-related protein
MLPRRSLPGLGAAMLLTLPAAAHNAVLVMLERHDCPWCKRWHAEIGERAWNQSNLGRIAPLRRVDIAQGLPEDLRHLQDWRVTPSFILLADNREIGRMVGYPGDLFFWQQAEMLLARLPK